MGKLYTNKNPEAMRKDFTADEWAEANPWHPMEEHEVVNLMVLQALEVDEMARGLPIAKVGELFVKDRTFRAKFKKCVCCAYILDRLHVLEYLWTWLTLDVRRYALRFAAEKAAFQLKDHRNSPPPSKEKRPRNRKIAPRTHSKGAVK